MGTLYDCLREARLEKYYSAFRANGITCSEALAHLTMPEFCAMGISGAEDRRRLVELVNIIKSVHRGQNSSGSTAPRKRHPGSPTPNSARSGGAGGGGMGGGGVASQSDKKVPRRHVSSPAFSPSEDPAHSISSRRLEPTRQVSVRERGPNFSVASYLDMLEFMSDDSQSDSSDHQPYSPSSANQPQQPPLFRNPTPSASVSSVSSTSGKVPRKVALGERAKQPSKAKGYNYGVPNNRTPSARSKNKATGRPSRDEKIRVCVRKRPLSRRESRASDTDIVVAGSTTTLVVKEPKVTVDLSEYTMKHKFVFDEVFDEVCTNEDVYIRAARPLIGSVFERGNATFFAYGQTGAGKTHTMIGGHNVPGLYQLAAQDVFDIIASGHHGNDLRVWVSFFEIYCGQLFDLLNKRNRLVAREDGAQRVCIAGLTETEVPDVGTLIKVLQYGNSVRSRGTSNVNPDSSRSHAVLQLEIRHSDEDKLGKISFIDLAGSERASDMGDPDRQTRMEGAEINQSLLALKECIRSIDQESRHTPFRQSKLTHILKDAFVGNSRTCMIANVSPAQSSCEHTLNTLRYADRVKELRREGSQSGGGGATFGQAMTLLMNIPITAPPSVFHPHNVLSTSTPVRPSASRNPTHHHPPQTAADITLDPSETPIRGHNVAMKAVGGRNKPRSANFLGAAASSSSRLLSQPGNRTSGCSAAQGVQKTPPEASPSESDQTDTDSNNVTHPTVTRPAPSQPNIPVIGSLDTEFDFPTSDFNNIDDDGGELNDLNQGRNNLNKAKEVQVQAPTLTPLEGQQGRGQDGGDQASAAFVDSPLSAFPKSRASSSTGQLTSGSSTNALSGDVKGRAKSSPTHRQSSTTSVAPDSKRTKNLRNAADRLPSAASLISHAREKLGAQTKAGEARGGPGAAGPLGDSFDDELLFAGPGDSEGSNPKFQQSSQSPVPTSATVKTNKHLMNVLPAMQTALSSDLTSFAQRSPLRGATDRALPSPGDPPSECSPLPHGSFSPREGSVVPGTKGFPKDCFPGAENDPMFFPAVGATARAWGEPAEELGKLSSVPKKASSAPSQLNNLPFASYGVADSSPRGGALSARECAKPGLQQTGQFRTDEVGLEAASHRGVALHGHSGPSSDPTVPSAHNLLLPAHLAKDPQNFASLPPHSASSQSAGVRQDVGAVDSRSRNPPPASSSSTASLASARTSSSSSAVLVTEKLLSGAVFSPIHPQPVSVSDTHVNHAGLAAREASASIVHPMPVTAFSSETAVSVSVSGPALVDRERARVSLVAAHEDQLAAITSLCKQEMKLLLSAKKTIPRSFDDYMNRVSGILSQKLSAIQILQKEIQGYRDRFATNPPPVAVSSVSVSDMGSASQRHA